MSDTLKDQLLKLGFKQPAREPRRPVSVGEGHTPARAMRGESRRAPPRPDAGAAQRRSREDMDLAKAYAIRAQKEKDERIAAERQRQEEARQRREARNALAALLEKARLNDAAAEIARHFEYGGKIRRIHVTSDQLKALNAGELAVVQLAGRYHLVSLADADQAVRLMPDSLALKVEPGQAEGGEDYSDPRFQVPDDLVW